MDPTRVGSYSIERTLGSGGMGTVFLGRHIETGRPAAVKVLPPSMAREEGFVARFTREIDATRQLTNPHVVALYESGQDGDMWYYAMEYVEGETLTERLRRDRRIGWREVIDIALQICSALKAAHDAGIVHRDLKPSNLMLSSDGTVKLTDFGVAQVFAGGKLTVTGGIIGTAEYMSPEQAAGARATKKSDLYSLGAVMYAMLTGRPPFTGKDQIEVIGKHRYGQFDKPSRYVELPHWLEEIVCQLLEKDPDKRPPDAYVLSRRLQEVVRKIELSSDEQTISVSRFNDPTGPTMAADEAGADYGGPAAGTLMRDLVRAEIERQQEPSAIGRLFNNTWVLLALLVLVVLGGVLWFERDRLTAEQRFATGAALMKQPEGRAWIEARDEYFLPLIEEDRRRWEPEVAEYLQQIEVYELKSQLAPKALRPKAEPARTEPQRLLQLAIHARDGGDTAKARRTLESLLALLDGQPDHESTARAAQALLDELKSAEQERERESFVAAALARAEALARDGQADEARAIWRGIVELYEHDPAAQAEVRQARDALADQRTSDASNLETTARDGH